MKKQVILATTNMGKVKEFQALLEPLDIQVMSIHDLEGERIPEVVEDGETFEENALKKARAFYRQFNIPALADDSGLEVDYLNGEPGIYSARYAGEGKNDQDNIEKLLEKLKEVKETELRKAHFTCAIAFVDGAEEETVTRGECHGVIASQPRGENGFGYDPIFYLPEEKRTMAELSKEEKNKISHRSVALKKLVENLSVKIVD
ncbi:XTP/dITP diphosphatase [Caldalkalibacillus mannanilyticus]|uniref:XTP/dITP diphosphatase n=1 Tax=Caldalkalibacillus mannanilyticus TaxID=1418 RepID=UPI000468636A|nr:XTP/dITP diphosphatase [Caldalkalibacillus mannanilyticus]